MAFENVDCHPPAQPDDVAVSDPTSGILLGHTKIAKMLDLYLVCLTAARAGGIVSDTHRSCQTSNGSDPSLPSVQVLSRQERPCFSTPYLFPQPLAFPFSTSSHHSLLPTHHHSLQLLLFVHQVLHYSHSKHTTQSINSYRTQHHWHSIPTSALLLYT